MTDLEKEKSHDETNNKTNWKKNQKDLPYFFEQFHLCCVGETPKNVVERAEEFCGPDFFFILFFYKKCPGQEER